MNLMLESFLIGAFLVAGLLFNGMGIAIGLHSRNPVSVWWASAAMMWNVTALILYFTRSM